MHKPRWRYLACGVGCAVLLLLGCARWTDEYALETLDEARAVAAESGKPILISFQTAWCGSCQRFSRAARQDDQLSELLQGVVFLEVDSEAGGGTELAQAYDVRAYPTFLVLTAAGEVIDRWRGYGKRRFAANLRTMLADPLPIAEREARHTSQPNAADAARLGAYRLALGQPAPAANLLREAERLNKDPQRDYRTEIFEALTAGLQRNIFSVEQMRAAGDAAVASPHCTPHDLMSVAWTFVRVGVETGDSMLVNAYLERAISAAPETTDPELENSRKRLMVEYALHVQHDQDLAVRYMKESLPEDWAEYVPDINSFAWWCFESGVNLEEAELVARRAVERARPGAEEAMVLDTLAEILNARGNPEAALVAADRAAAADPHEMHYQRQAARFRNIVAQE